MLCNTEVILPINIFSHDKQYVSVFPQNVRPDR